MLSKKRALEIYAKIAPDDEEALDASDPRQADIIVEMRGVGKAKSIDEARSFIGWWSWPEGQAQMDRTIRRIWRMARR